MAAAASSRTGTFSGARTSSNDVGNDASGAAAASPLFIVDLVLSFAVDAAWMGRRVWAWSRPVLPFSGRYMCKCDNCRWGGGREVLADEGGESSVRFCVLEEAKRMNHFVAAYTPG